LTNRFDNDELSAQFNRRKQPLTENACELLVNILNKGTPEAR
jgi:hypothetical protein